MRRKVSALPSHSQYSHHCHSPPQGSSACQAPPATQAIHYDRPITHRGAACKGKDGGGDCEPCFWWVGNNNTGGMNQYFFLLRDWCLFQTMVSKSDTKQRQFWVECIQEFRNVIWCTMISFGILLFGEFSFCVIWALFRNSLQWALDSWEELLLFPQLGNWLIWPNPLPQFHIATRA